MSRRSANIAESLNLKPRTRTRLGWKPDLPDVRDYIYLPRRGARLPAAIDMRKSGLLPPVWDQSTIGSCTAHGVGALVAYVIKDETGKDFMPSRLFIYFNERVIEGTTSSDDGAQIRDGIKTVAKVGAAPESLWPYAVRKFATQPPKKAYDAAPLEVALAYQSVPRTGIKNALAAGHPVVFGFTVYSTFQDGTENAPGYLTPMPTNHDSVEGGHCVLAVGYDDARQAYLIRNSWGADWCDGGHFWMPYAYVANAKLASDFWTITQIGK